MKINKIIKVLIGSDIFLNTGWGFLGPVFAVFILRNIQGGDVKIIGYSAMIYWFSKSLLQLPIARYLDKYGGENDDFYFLLLGMFLTGFVPLGYLISSQPFHIYLFQVLHALGMAMVIPPWNAIFTRHLDKNNIAFEWTLDSTALGISIGIAGGIGGVLVAKVGFKSVFLLASIFTFLAGILLISIRKDLLPSKEKFFPPFKRFLRFWRQ